MFHSIQVYIGLAFQDFRKTDSIYTYTDVAQYVLSLRNLILSSSYIIQASNSTTLALESSGIAKVSQMTSECKYDSLVTTELL